MHDFMGAFLRTLIIRLLAVREAGIVGAATARTRGICGTDYLKVFVHYWLNNGSLLLWLWLWLVRV